MTDAPRSYLLQRDGRRAELREHTAGVLDVLDVLARDLLDLADTNGLELVPVGSPLPNVLTFTTAQILPVLEADGWRVVAVPDCTCAAGNDAGFPAQHATLCPRFAHPRVFPRRDQS